MRNSVLSLAFVLAGLGLWPVFAQTGSTASESITYRFENDRFLIPRIRLEITPVGGRLVFSRRGLSEPVTRDVPVAEATTVRLRERIERLGFLKSTEVYQTKEDHSNLGITTIGIRSGGYDRDVSFNYTANRDMAEVASLLRGIANREILRFDIETAIRFQPLEIPNLIESLTRELNLGRVTDAELLMPLLDEIADDPTLPLIGRNQARKLLEKIRKTSGGRK